MAPTEVAFGAHSNKRALSEASDTSDDTAIPSKEMRSSRPVGFAIIGMGRAGKIHTGVLSQREDAEVRWLVDVAGVKGIDPPASARCTTDLAEALADPLVDAVVVATPTPYHAENIFSALAAGKHVFAEKPLCSDSAVVPKLFEAADKAGLTLDTAFNRRFDPRILEAKAKIASGEMGRVLAVTLVSRDFPYPTVEFLKMSGNIFKDCVVHDLDYLTWLLNDEPRMLRATATTSHDDRAAGMWELSEVHLSMQSGATATLINCRVSDSYDHRLDIFCEKGIVRIANPDGPTGLSFAQHFEKSYHAQMESFVQRIRSFREGEEKVHHNVSLERTKFLEHIVDACERSVALGGSEIRVDDEAPPMPSLRTYDDTTALRVRDQYQTMRKLQTVEHVRKCRAKYGALGTRKMTVWEALAELEGFVDVSDPDVELPNLHHLYQTAEGIRAKGLPDWLQLVGFIHDLGKVIHLRGCKEDGTSLDAQWSIVGDTFVVGCALPDKVIFPQFNAANPDMANPELSTETGMYAPGCGLDNTLVAYGHDEYMYEVLRQNPNVKLPKEALYIVRYHSLYPWHDAGCYAALESDYDRCMKGWVKLFNQFDLYTKRNIPYTAEDLASMRDYYSGLIDKYLPGKLDW